MKIQITKSVECPVGHYNLAANLAETIIKMKVGESFCINYMLWSKIGAKVSVITKFYGLKLVSRRGVETDIKNTRIWVVASKKGIRKKRMVRAL